MRVKYASARKIPHLRVLPFLLVALWANEAPGQAADSLEAFKAARSAEAEYERAARRLAPLGTSEQGGECDEYVGRFCLYYDSGRDPLPAEPPEIRQFRERAIDRLETALAFNPARPATAFPLVRLYLENRQPAGAVAVAHRFRAASTDAAAGAMLLTAALHAAARITEAEEAIADWLAAVDSAERRRLGDLRWLLTSQEEKRYRQLTGTGLEAYERRFWRYADALYLTAGNEVRTEHFARHAESRLIEIAPFVFGATSWGTDVAELTIRYGTVKARTRRWPPPIGGTDLQITEHWDPEQMSYAAPELDTVLRIRARPAVGWPLDTVRSVSGHAPSTFRRMVALEHQANVFQDPDGALHLRVDGIAVRDSAAGDRAPYQQGLFVMDADLAVVAGGPAPAWTRGDSLLVRSTLPLPRAGRFYSAEVLDGRTRFAARARYPIELPLSDDGLFLSSILIARPFPPGALPTSRAANLDPLPSLVLTTGQSFGVYAEVVLGRPAPAKVNVELELVSIDGSPALLRAARWLGQRLGIGGRPPPRRLTWTAEIADARPTAIAVTIDPGNVKAGRYLVEMAVVHGGRRAAARREIVFSDAGTN